MQQIGLTCCAFRWQCYYIIIIIIETQQIFLLHLSCDLQCRSRLIGDDNRVEIQQVGHGRGRRGNRGRNLIKRTATSWCSASTFEWSFLHISGGWRHTAAMGDAALDVVLAQPLCSRGGIASVAHGCRGQSVRLEKSTSSAVASNFEGSKLLLGPGVHLAASDARNVCAHLSVLAAALDAQEDPKGDAGPLWAHRLTIHAAVIGRISFPDSCESEDQRFAVHLRFAGHGGGGVGCNCSCGCWGGGR
mmetsp:Transcript_52629/g.112276  ORF Transcript_52629/g.112276 Transcript_52629/m.112276 type:complete len:246 (+) Transcript_52629:742-1479(+)